MKRSGPGRSSEGCVEESAGRLGDEGGFYGTEDRHASQGDILDTSLNLTDCSA